MSVRRVKISLAYQAIELPTRVALQVAQVCQTITICQQSGSRKLSKRFNKTYKILSVMKSTLKKYSVPQMEMQELEVERGFSLSYGGEGEPGQDSGYNDSDFEL